MLVYLNFNSVRDQDLIIYKNQTLRKATGYSCKQISPKVTELESSPQPVASIYQRCYYKKGAEENEHGSMSPFSGILDRWIQLCMGHISHTPSITPLSPPSILSTLLLFTQVTANTGENAGLDCHLKEDDSPFHPQMLILHAWRPWPAHKSSSLQEGKEPNPTRIQVLLYNINSLSEVHLYSRTCY